MMRSVLRAAAAASAAVTSTSSPSSCSMMRRSIFSAAITTPSPLSPLSPLSPRWASSQQQQISSFSNGGNGNGKRRNYSSSSTKDKGKAKGKAQTKKDSWKKKDDIRNESKKAAAAQESSSSSSSNPNPSSPPSNSRSALEEIEAICRAAQEERDRRLAEDENDKSLDVGPNGRSLFTSVTSISHLTRKDVGTYMNFDMEQLKAVLPEGLPMGMLKEFDDSRRSALLVRQSFLDLRDNFRRIVDPPLRSSDGKGPTVRKQIVLDGPVSCGKSIALAMLVHWARDEGWLVFYVPRGREWTHGGFYYKNPQTGLWDTPSQAANVLQARL